MLKVFSPHDQERLLAYGPTSRIIQTNAQIKEASSSKITRELLEQFKPEKNSFLIHAVAMGDDEHYGFNRNHDAWTGDWLNKKHATFVTHGHYYREHENRRKDQRIGSIKASSYDPEMGRVELIIHGHLKPRDGEPLTAEPEYERAKAGKNVDGSMSCKIAGDTCTCCGNFAPNAAHYCFVEGTDITMADGTVKPVETVQEGDLVMAADGQATKVVALINHDIDEEVVELVAGISNRRTVTTASHPYLALPFGCAELLGGKPRHSRAGGGEDYDLTQRPAFTFAVPKPDFVEAGALRTGDLLFSPGIPTVDRREVTLEEAYVLGFYTAEGCQVKAKGVVRGAQFNVHSEKPSDVAAIARVRALLSDKFGAKFYSYTAKGSKGLSWRTYNRPAAVWLWEHCGEYSQLKQVPAAVLRSDAAVRVSYLQGLMDGDGHQYEDSTLRLNTSSKQLAHQVYGLYVTLGYTAYVSKFLNAGGPGDRTNKTDGWYVSVNATPQSLDRFHYAGRNVTAIKSITRRQFKGKVYNFETEDHTYVADNHAVHNCDCFRNYRGQWHPEYQKMAYVLNPDPLFFDYSSVANRADRTARFLEYKFNDGTGHTAKAASSVRSLTGTDLAEAYGIVEPRTPMSAETRMQLRLLKGATYLRRDTVFMKVASSVMPSAQLTDGEVEVFRAARAPALLRKLAKAKVVLPFHSYVAVFGGLTLKEASESVVMQRAQTYAAGDGALDLAEDMGTPEMESTFISAHKDTENVGCDDVDQLMDGVADRLGMRDGVSEERPACATPKLAALTIELAPGDETMAKAWAASYGVYKAACLRELETFHGEAAARLLPILSVM